MLKLDLCLKLKFAQSTYSSGGLIHLIYIVPHEERADDDLNDVHHDGQTWIIVVNANKLPQIWFFLKFDLVILVDNDTFENT